jgi:predicted unusual protein kinase regulating ubiquinone biosynthesis (AarF/ABC1/UbiB family)
VSRRPPEPAPLTAGRRFRLLAVYRTAAVVLASYGLHAVAGRLRGAEWADAELPRVHRANARRVLATILEVRGLFIKVGQLVSVLSSVLPADFRDELAELQDRIPPRPWEEIRGRLAAELGDPETVFAEVDRTPVAAASLAQVHSARLADGRRVAVKVQHLGVERLARLDLATVRRVLRIVSLATGARGLGELFDEVERTILDELDFTAEAHHLEAIAAAFADDPMIGCPEVVWALSTPRVLVTGFVDGVQVADLESLDERGIDRPALAERILRAWCRMIFVDGVYHADPHPGNLLIRDDGGVNLVDFGAVGRVTPAMREGIPRLVEGVVRRDRQAILRALGRMGFVPRRPGDDVAQRVIDYVYSRLLDQVELDSWRLADLRFDPRMKVEMLADLRRLDLAVRDLTAAFVVPREWILLLRTLVLLVGVCTRLDPELQPLAVVRPYLEELVLGGDRDRLGLVRAAVKDLGMAALALPGDFHRLLAKAERGELEVEVRGLRDSAGLLYALGHQLLWGGFAVAAGGLAYAARAAGDPGLAELLGWTAGGALLLLGGSLWKARKLLRAVRRGARS